MECRRLMGEVLAPFGAEMVRLIEQSDQEIVRRRIRVASVQQLYAVTSTDLQKQFGDQIKGVLSQTASTVAEGRLRTAGANSPHTWLGVPLALPNDQRIVGVISLDSAHHDTFSAEMEKAQANPVKAPAIRKATGSRARKNLRLRALRRKGRG